jgi:hypothetical protein
VNGEDQALPCFYCGDPADTVDHVVPQSLIDSARNSGDEALLELVQERRRRMTVPACRECNGLAGAKYHQTLDERTRFIQGRLARKHAKVLSMPDWTDSEFTDMADLLRNLIIARLIERDHVRRRLRYHRVGVTPPHDGLIELLGQPRSAAPQSLLPS